MDVPGGLSVPRKDSPVVEVGISQNVGVNPFFVTRDKKGKHPAVQNPFK